MVTIESILKRPRTSAGILVLYVTLLSTLSFNGARAAPVYIQDIGSPGPGPGQFVAASGITTDAQGNLYVADATANKVLKYSSTGEFLASWGSSGSGPGQFSGAADAAVLADNTILVTDANNMRVQVFNGALAYVTEWPVGRNPEYIAVGTSGLLYINSGDYMLVYGADGSRIDGWRYTFTATTAARGFGVASGDTLFISDGTSVKKYDRTGVKVLDWGGFGNGDGQFHEAGGATVDMVGRVHVSDGAGRVQAFSQAGKYLLSWGETELSYLAQDIASDSFGNIFVLTDNRILKFGNDPTPVRQIRWGSLKRTYR